MPGLLLKLACVLATLLVLAIITIHTLPYEDTQLITFISAAENCGGSCLLGIRAGKTTVSQAMAHLYESAWVNEVNLSAGGTGYGQIRWSWSGAQPAIIDTVHDGRLTFYWDREENIEREVGDSRVETISIYTSLRLDSLRTWFGQPDSGTASFRLDADLGYSAAYHDAGTTLSFSTILPCPINWMSYWNAHTKITMSMGSGTSQYVTPTEIVKIC